MSVETPLCNLTPEPPEKDCVSSGSIEWEEGREGVRAGPLGSPFQRLLLSPTLVPAGPPG